MIGEDRRSFAVHRTGQAVQNAFVESFNGKLREERLNLHWFRSLHHARQVIVDQRKHYNGEMLNEAISMRGPAEAYAPSSRLYDSLPDLDYAFHDRDILVTACGQICMFENKINVSTVLAGQGLGIKEVVDGGIWLIHNPAGVA